MALTKMDPLSSPDLLFPMPDRAAPLCHITPNDVKLLMRPNEKGDNADKFVSAAWEALINLFFAMTQIMRLCIDYEQINKVSICELSSTCLGVAGYTGIKYSRSTSGKGRRT